MTIISFQLTMPNVASWNGKWSGQDKKYYIIIALRAKDIQSKEHFKELLEKKRDSWYYRWEDGWGASVIAEVIDATEAKKRRKISSGFCGYDWMVDSIMKRGKILASDELIEQLG